MQVILKRKMRRSSHQYDGTIQGPGFCQVYNPNSASRFGQFNPIRNGTAHRLNWEVISILQNILQKENKDFLDDYEDEDQDKVRRARAKRVKNGGEFSSVVGLPQRMSSLPDSLVLAVAIPRRPV